MLKAIVTIMVEFEYLSTSLELDNFIWETICIDSKHDLWRTENVRSLASTGKRCPWFSSCQLLHIVITKYSAGPLSLKVKCLAPTTVHPAQYTQYPLNLSSNINGCILAVIYSLPEHSTVASPCDAVCRSMATVYFLAGLGNQLMQS